MLSLVVSGCSSDGPTGNTLRSDTPAFRTDSAVVTLRTTTLGYDGRIEATFTNTTKAPVYFVNCGGATGVMLEQQTGTEWKVVWSPMLPMCLSQPIIVPSGDSHRFSIEVVAGNPGSNLHPQFSTDTIDGTYRLTWTEVLTSYHDDRFPFGDPLPAELRRSNQFRLTVVGS